MDKGISDPPIFQGGPDPIDTLTNAQVIPPGYPEREKVGRIYISIQGDWWDMIAIRCYGRQRGNEHLMFRLLEANYPLRDICEFPAGLAVIVPEVEVKTEIQLVPWKKAARLP